MPEEKTTLFSPTNQDWRRVKSKTTKMNNLLTNIPTNDIMDFNNLIYTGEKLVYKTQSPLDDH